MQKGDVELLRTHCRRFTERRVNGAHARTHTRAPANEEESGCGSLRVKQAYDRISLHVVNLILTPKGSGTLSELQHGLTGPHARTRTHTHAHASLHKHVHKGRHHKPAVSHTLAERLTQADIVTDTAMSCQSHVNSLSSVSSHWRVKAHI